MRSILAAIAVALLTAFLALTSAPVAAQKGGAGNSGTPDTRQKENEADASMRARQRKDIDSGYKSAIDRLPDQKLDPWRNLR